MIRKYLLFDFDNTLAYRNGMWTETIYTLLKKHGCTNYTIEDVRPYLMHGFPWHTPEICHKDFFNDCPWWEHMEKYFVEILDDLGVEKELGAKIAHEVKNEYLDISNWQLYDDTIPTLERAVNEGYTNVIVSNHVPELEELVDKFGLSGYFESVINSAVIGYEKPNPEMYKYALSTLKDMQSAVMIGDSYKADVQGALAAGIDAILVRKENVNHYPKYSKDLTGVFEFLL